MTWFEKFFSKTENLENSHKKYYNYLPTVFAKNSGIYLLTNIKNLNNLPIKFYIGNSGWLLEFYDNTFFAIEFNERKNLVIIRINNKAFVNLKLYKKGYEIITRLAVQDSEYAKAIEIVVEKIIKTIEEFIRIAKDNKIKKDYELKNAILNIAVSPI